MSFGGCWFGSLNLQDTHPYACVVQDWERQASCAGRTSYAPTYSYRGLRSARTIPLITLLVDILKHHIVVLDRL
jgi:hypothetical protein